MKRLILILIAVMCAAWLGAVPALPGAYRVETQPDGTQVKIYIHGDEWYSYLTDSLGYLYERDEDGALKRDARGFLVKSREIMTEEKATKLRIARMKETTSNGPLKSYGLGASYGAPRILVFLIQFPDTTFHLGNQSWSVWNDFFNKEGYDHNGSPGSVRDYFIAQSGGKYKPQFDVYGPITVKHDWRYYPNRVGYDYGNGPQTDMVWEALRKLNKNIDYSQYDADNNGLIDCVFILYAGYNAASTGMGIWPHYRFGPFLTTVPGEFDGKDLMSYACSSELSHTIQDRAGIGTVAHELSHAFGLPDYYQLKSAPEHPGLWSLMSSGNYLNLGITPPNYSYFDKLYLGWDTLRMAKPGEKIKLEPSKTGYCISKHGKTSATNPTDLYYIIENRQDEGWDKFLPHGLLIWKLKYNKDNWKNNCPNNTNSCITVLNNTVYPGHDNKTSQYLFPNRMISHIKEDWQGNITADIDRPLLYMEQNGTFPGRGESMEKEEIVFDWKVGEPFNLKTDLFGYHNTDFDIQYDCRAFQEIWPNDFHSYMSHTAPKAAIREGFSWTEKLESERFRGFDQVQFRIKAKTRFKKQVSEPFYSNLVTFNLLYKLSYTDAYGNKYEKYYQPGSRIPIPLPECYEFSFDLGQPLTFDVVESSKGKSLVFEMPASDLEITMKRKTSYKVMFYDWDGTYVSEDQVPCGEDAMAPTMTRPGFVFKGWSQDITNVHAPLTVYAEYATPEGRDTYEIEMAAHECEPYPFTETYKTNRAKNKFENNKSRAMVRDRLTFRFKHTATDAGNVWFQWTADFDEKGTPDFKEGGNVKVAHLSLEEAMNDQAVEHTYSVCNEPSCMNEKTNAERIAFRFRYETENTSMIYSTAPMVFDIYYPQFLKCKQSDKLSIRLSSGDKSYSLSLPNDGEKVGDYIYGMFPAQYNEKVYLFDSEKYNTEDCLEFKRLRYKTWPTVNTDLTEDGIIYYTPTGFTDTIQITKAVYAVHFKYRKSDGEGSYIGYDDVQYIPCGSSAVMPSFETINYDPEHHPFTEWLCDNKPDDTRWMEVREELWYNAYYDYLPDPNYYTVTFVDWNGDVIGEPQKVEEGEDAKAPEPPAREGYHFTHWDKSFDNVQTDKTVTALYGQDGVTWKVTYLDYNADWLGEEIVPDGADAVADLTPYRTGYRFLKWNAILTDFHDDRIATAQYEKVDIPLHKVTVIAKGGHVEVSPKQVDLDQVNDGTRIELTPVPDENYEFKGWEGYTPFSGLTVTADTTVTAKFEKLKENPGTGVDNVSAKFGGYRKLLRDGILYIERNGQLYTITGQKVK